MPEKMRLPLILLGNRQTGKTTGLCELARKGKLTLVAPNYAMALEAKDKCPKISVESCEANYHPEEKKVIVVDEFMLCKRIPKNAQIYALSCSITELPRVLKKLEKMGYCVQAHKDSACRNKKKTGLLYGGGILCQK